MPTPEQLEWLRTVLRIDVRHADVETSDNAFGFKTKAKGKEYEGEHEKVGWRSNDPVERERTHLVTRKYDDEDRLRNTRKVDGEGRVVDHLGNVVQNEKRGYVVDPKTGEMIMFSQVQENRNGRKENNHHTTPTGGEDVAGAGGATFEKGKVTRIDNDSGHYKPQLVHLLQTVEHLTAQGATLETHFVGPDGKALDPDDPDVKRYKKLQPKLKILPGLRVELVALQKELARLDDEKAGERELSQVQSRLEAVKAQVDEITAEMQSVAKLGVGRSNRLLDTKVAFKEISSSMTGAQIRTQVVAREMTAKEFMQGGANPAQKSRKGSVLQDIKDSGGLTPSEIARRKKAGQPLRPLDQGQDSGDGVSQEYEDLGYVEQEEEEPVVDLGYVNDEEDTVDGGGNPPDGEVEDLGYVDQEDEPPQEPVQFVLGGYDNDPSEAPEEEVVNLGYVNDEEEVVDLGSVEQPSEPEDDARRDG